MTGQARDEEEECYVFWKWDTPHNANNFRICISVTLICADSYTSHLMASLQWSSNTDLLSVNLQLAIC